jgi:hypothetical protein
LEQRKEFLIDLIKTVRKNQKNSPQGMLRINHTNGRIQFYYREKTTDNNGRYIPLSEMTFIRKLAQKDYNEKVLKAAEKELMGIDGYLKYLPQYRAEDIYTNLACERQALVTPFFETDEMFRERWESVSYERKGFPDDFPEFLTDRGERVRSKSELIIANLLAKAGVPYRFEYPLYLKGLGLIHPDFMVLNLRLRREFFWEHRGMMDDPGYVENAIRRENCYHLNGFYPGDRLILTSETKASPLNVRQIKEVIEHYLL